MTISSSNRKAGPYQGNGLTSVFPFSFRVFAKADLQVIYTNTSGVESTLTLDSNYAVFLNEDQANNPGGTITYPHPTAIIPVPPKLAAGEKITVLGNVTFEQLVDLTNNGGFYPEVIETALDKLTMQTLQLKEQVGRAIVANVSSNVTPGQYFEQVVNYTAEAEAAAASAIAAATAASPVIPYLDEINTLAPIAPQIVEVAAHSASVDNVGSNIGYIQAVGGDLAGSGWGYDFGAITDAATQQATATSSIIAVANNISAVQNASANAASAAASAASALASLNTFKGQYYGALSANPALDPLGNAVGAGDLYFNTGASEMRVYTGSAWVAAYITGSFGTLAYKNVVQSADLDTTLDLGSV